MNNERKMMFSKKHHSRTPLLTKCSECDTADFSSSRTSAWLALQGPLFIFSSCPASSSCDHKDSHRRPRCSKGLPSCQLPPTGELCTEESEEPLKDIHCMTSVQGSDFRGRSFQPSPPCKYPRLPGQKQVHSAFCIAHCNLHTVICSLKSAH